MPKPKRQRGASTRASRQPLDGREAADLLCRIALLCPSASRMPPDVARAFDDAVTTADRALRAFRDWQENQSLGLAMVGDVLRRDKVGGAGRVSEATGISVTAVRQRWGRHVATEQGFKVVGIAEINPSSEIGLRCLREVLAVPDIGPLPAPAVPAPLPSRKRPRGQLLMARAGKRVKDKAREQDGR